MARPQSRRQFIGTAAGIGASLGLADLAPQSAKAEDMPDLVRSARISSRSCG